MTEPFRIGTPVQAADWFCGPEGRAKARGAIRKAMQALESEARIVLGPVSWQELSPDDANAPPPRDDAPVGTMLLIGEAVVRAVLPPPANDEGAFVNELEPDDLARLRQITRQAYAKNNPGQSLTDAECDAVINRLGPNSAAKALSATPLH